MRETKIGLGLGTVKLTCSGVVCASNFLGGVKGNEPDARFLVEVADVGGVAALRAFPDASVADLLVGR